MNETEKIEKAINVLQKIAKGIDPLTGGQISEDSFLNDPKIIRCFYFVSEVLDNVVKGAYSNRNLTNFNITEEQRKNVVFPEGKIGVNEFSKVINKYIDPITSKKITGVELNKRLKKRGILSEVETNDGKKRTVTNDSSIKYGFESISREYNGVEYDQVVINDKGKYFLLENLEKIMNE